MVIFNSTTCGGAEGDNINLPRKIQLTGRNTYIVSLPHEWVLRHNITKGTPVYLSESESGYLSLALALPGAKKSKTCTIKVSKTAPESSMRNIVSAYVSGANQIVLNGTGMSTIAEEARRLLSGVEITEETNDSLTLKVLQFDDVDIDGIIRRAFNVTRSMFELAAAVYRDGSDVFTEIERKEDDVDRLYLLLLRTMCVGSSNQLVLFKVIAAKSIEKISDHIEDLCLFGKSLDRSPVVAELISRASDVYSAAYQLLSKNELDLGQFAEAKREYLACFAKAEATIKKEKSVSNLMALRMLLEKCNKILRYSEDIMETSSDMYFAKMDADA